MLYCKIEQIWNEEIKLDQNQIFSIEELLNFCENNKFVPIPSKENLNIYKLDEKLMFIAKPFDINLN